MIAKERSWIEAFMKLILIRSYSRRKEISYDHARTQLPGITFATWSLHAYMGQGFSRDGFGTLEN